MSVLRFTGYGCVVTAFMYGAMTIVDGQQRHPLAWWLMFLIALAIDDIRKAVTK